MQRKHIGDTYREATLVIKNDMASLARGLRPNDSLRAHHLGSEWRLGLVSVQGNVRLVPVRLSLEKVLRLRSGGELDDGSSGCEDARAGCEEFVRVIDGFDYFDGLLCGDRGRRDAGAGESNCGKHASRFCQGLCVLKSWGLLVKQLWIYLL